MFLPWGSRYSLDARKGPLTGPGWVRSLASSGMLLQIASLIFFSALHKLNSPFWTRGEAVGLVLQDDMWVSPAGELFWAARVRHAPTNQDEAYMRGHAVLIREGVTRVEGELVTALAGDDDAFTLDPGGRFFLGRVELQEAGEALVLIDLGGVEPFGGCRSPGSDLRRVGGSARFCCYFSCHRPPKSSGISRLCRPSALTLRSPQSAMVVSSSLRITSSAVVTPFCPIAPSP